MYVSRLSFYTRPGHTEEVAQRLQQLAKMIGANDGRKARVLRMSFGSLGSPDLQFEEEIQSLAELERGMEGVISKDEFQRWSAGMSDLLLQTPKREILTLES
jgi:hypothetical protein